MLRILTRLAVALSMTRAVSAYCYWDATSFETGDLRPDYSVTSGGVISHNAHFPGFSIVNDGTPTSPNTGVSNEDYPYFIAFDVSSTKSAPSMQLASASSFSLRTVNFACFEDKPSGSSAGSGARGLPAVDCDVTLTCTHADGSATSSQTLPYTCGDNGGDCGASGLRNAPMQAAALDLSRFACCKKVAFAAKPRRARPAGANPVAVGFDTFSFYYDASALVAGRPPYPQSTCGCRK